MIDITNNLLDLSSAIIVVITATLLYFGKIIADTKVEKFEKTDLLINGLFFTLLFLMFPIALNIFFLQKNWIINIQLWIIVLFQLVLMSIYSRQYNSYKTIRKFNLESEYDSRFDKKITEIKENKPVIAKMINQKQDLLKQSLNLFDLIFRFFENQKVLLILSTAIFYSIMITIRYNLDILSITSIAILSFVNLSLIAIAYGTSTAYNPFSKITLIDGKSISGKTIKFGEFVYIVKGKKKYFINKDQIKTIEQNVMKTDDAKDEAKIKIQTN